MEYFDVLSSFKHNEPDKCVQLENEKRLLNDILFDSNDQSSASSSFTSEKISKNAKEDDEKPTSSERDSRPWSSVSLHTITGSSDRTKVNKNDRAIQKL